MNITEILSNPIRIQVMQYLQTYDEATTKQIAEALSDISTPTLYRHINIMLEQEALIVKEERKVRGGTERLLVINEEKFGMSENLSQDAYQFLMGLYMKFQKYYENDAVNPKDDKLSLRTCILRLSDSRYDELMDEIGTVIEKYQMLNEGGKERNLSIISAPVDV